MYRIKFNSSKINKKIIFIAVVLLLVSLAIILGLSTKALAQNKHNIKLNIFKQNNSAQQDNKTGYINSNITIAQSSSNSKILKSYALPSSFDARTAEGYGLTSVKNQAPFGSCWTFSLEAAAEASLIHHKQADKSLNLSERQLAYFFFNKDNVSDPLNLITKDYNSFTVNPPEDPDAEKVSTYMDAGGNQASSMWELASWCGPTLENAAPYNEIADYTSEEAKDPENPSPGYINYLMELGPDSEEWKKFGNKTWAEMNNLYHSQLTKCNLDSSKAFTSDAYHVQNIDQICFWDKQNNKPNLEPMKQSLLDHGALDMAYFENDNNYDAEHNSYYDPNNSFANHAACIVGWNDNFSKENFKGETKPESNGAWLVRNSWGSNEDCHDGYFWVSYYNKCFKPVYSEGELISESISYAYDLEKGDNYDNNYQYDGTGMPASVSGDELRHLYSVSDIFKVQNFSEKLEAVSIGVNQENTKFNVKIYKNPTSENPELGTLVSSQNVSFSNAGYHTVKLDNPVVLKKDETFSVVFETDENYLYYCEGIEQENGNTNHQIQIQYHPNFEEGQCFAGFKEGEETSWMDLYENNIGLRIKAFTKNFKNDISDASVADIPDQSYNGSEIEPDPSVTMDGKTLSKNTDYTISYENNKNAGTASLTITGIGDYEGSQTKTFKINKVSLKATYVSANVNYNDYMTDKYKPEIKVEGFVNDEDASTATDYVAPSINLPAKDEIQYNTDYFRTPEGGSAKNYVFKQYIEGKLHINQKDKIDINKAIISDIEAVKYTGKEQVPEPIISYDASALVKDKDYTLTYKNNIDASTEATITITGIGDFENSRSINFTILKEQLDVTADSYTINNTDIPGFKPSFKVEGFVEGESAESETEKGKYNSPTVKQEKIIGPGESCKLIPEGGNAKNYTFNYISGTLSINPLIDITDASIEGIDASVEYTSQDIKPNPQISYNNQVLVLNKDYTLEYKNNHNVGTAVIIISGIGNYTNTTNVNFEITKATLTATFESATIDYSQYKKYQPQISVTGFKGADSPSSEGYIAPTIEPLPIDVSPGAEYKRTPKDGTFEPNYSFKYIEGTLKINDAKDIGNAQIAAVNNVNYSGSAFTPEPAVTYNGITLVKNIDFIYTYENNKDAGIATVKVNGIGDYTNNTTTTFQILKVNLKASYISANVDYDDYKADKYKPVIKVEGFVNDEDASTAAEYIAPSINLPSKDEIQYNTDYKITPKNGSAKNYEFNEYIEGTLHINAKEQTDISKATIEKISDLEYNASEQKPEPKISLGDIELKKDADYTLSYENNYNVGAARMIVSGINDYKGNAYANFNITKAPLTASYLGDTIHYLDFINYFPAIQVSGFKGKDTEKTAAGYIAPSISKPSDVDPGASYILKPNGGQANNYEFLNYIEGSLLIKKIEDNNLEHKDHTFISKINDFEYTAQEQKPEPVVTYKETSTNKEWTLTKGKDYTLSYNNNIETGIANLNITGIGNFTGSQTSEFKINPAPLYATYENASINIEDFEDYVPTTKVTGFLGEDKPETIQDYTAPQVDKPKTVETNKNYTLTPYGGNAGKNYKFIYQSGTLTVNNNIEPQPVPNPDNIDTFNSAQTFDNVPLLIILMIVLTSLTLLFGKSAYNLYCTRRPNQKAKHL